MFITIAIDHYENLEVIQLWGYDPKRLSKIWSFGLCLGLFSASSKPNWMRLNELETGY